MVNRVLILTALLTSLVTYQLWKVTWEDLFMQGLTFKDVLVMTVVCRMAMELKDYWLKKIALVFLSFNAIDMLDEWYGTPFNCGVNEYLAAGICAILIFNKELWLDKIFYWIRDGLITFGNRVLLKINTYWKVIKPILLTTIKPVANVFKKRDG